MAEKDHSDLQCSEFDALLSDALDKVLTGPKAEAFQAHASTCPICGPLLAEAEIGKHWLEQLVDAEPPAHLVHNILAATTGMDTVGQHQPAAAEASWLERAGTWAKAFARPIVAIGRQPRLAMSFGMAFFSLSISLSLAGVRLADLHRVDLRPSAIRRSYYETSGKVVKYYENIRFVYEIESRLREFKRVTAPPEPAPAKQEKNPRNNDTSEQPEQKQERNYGPGDSQMIQAALSDHPPAVHLAWVNLATLRRKA
ncbi:MAG TPA: zf-HC2 domain-containing protein [Terriglobales bacterium]|nr:zf-HC2 domain-containing protein [Terriglobales bacterium]